MINQVQIKSQLLLEVCSSTIPGTVVTPVTLMKFVLTPVTLATVTVAPDPTVEFTIGPLKLTRSFLY